MAVAHGSIGEARYGASGRSLGRLLALAAISGLVAGTIFAAFEMMAAAVKMGEASAAWMPLRMIGATVLGSDALMPEYSLGKAASAGMLVHMMLSAAFGLVFGGVAARSLIHRSTVRLIGAATAYGLVLWLVNFQVIARVAGWDWFPDGADQFWQGFVAHTIVFGSVLGALVAAVEAHRR